MSSYRPACEIAAPRSPGTTNAQRDHADFVNKLTQRGVEVVELHEVLAQSLQVPGARDWLLDRKITPNQVGLGLVDSTRAYLETLTERDLAFLTEVDQCRHVALVAVDRDGAILAVAR